MASKIILLLTLCFGLCFAREIEVDARTFFADEIKGESVLSGDVVIKRGDDILKAQKVFLYMDSKRQPLRYEASDEAHFVIEFNGKTYEGSAELFIYDVLKDTYEMRGNAFVSENKSDKKLYGDVIIFDKKQGTYLVESKNKPSKFVFELEEK